MKTLIPGVDCLFSHQGDDGYGIIRRHKIIRVTATMVVIDECPIGYTWESKAIELPMAELSLTGKARLNYVYYHTVPQADWWEGWRFGPPAGLIAALKDPKTEERLRRIIELEADRKSTEIEHSAAT